MGGFITATAMSRLPTLINRAVLCAPMLRMKCGMRALDFQHPLPQILAKWIAGLLSYLGLGEAKQFIPYCNDDNEDKAPFAKLFMIPGAYHEILCEQDAILQASLKVICDFFLQRSDDVHLVQPCYPLVQYDPSTPIYSLPELVMRGAGVALGVIGLAAGLAMIFTGERKI
eukprot:scaffold659_cov192-Ochromonas_danica.AAC.30